LFFFSSDLRIAISMGISGRYISGFVWVRFVLVRIGNNHENRVYRS
jgi:hypothetical protein